MRLIVLATVIATAAVPVLAQNGGGLGCGTHGNSPENPTIILALVGGLIMMWRARARPVK